MLYPELRSAALSRSANWCQAVGSWIGPGSDRVAEQGGDFSLDGW